MDQSHPYMMAEKGFALLNPLNYDLLGISETFVAFIGAWMVVVGLTEMFGRRQLWISIGSIVLLLAFGLRCTQTLSVLSFGGGWTSYSAPASADIERHWPPVVLIFWAIAGGLVLFSIVRLVKVRRALQTVTSEISD